MVRGTQAGTVGLLEGASIVGLNFLVLEGARKGDQFKVMPNLTIGRSKADITLRDSKASGLHAKIEAGPDGQLLLVDAGSSNGIWFEDKQVDQLLLKQGVVFRIGETVIEVIDENSAELSDEERDSWQGKLWSYFRAVASDTTPRQKLSAGPFSSFVKLTFSRGPFVGTDWVLGYGPRLIGTASPDLVIEDPDLPDLCFTLEPEDGAVRFKTAHPDRVHLNEKAIDSDVLRDGDVIRLGPHELRVSLGR